MTRETYVMRNGKLVPKRLAAPLEQKRRVHVISDDLGADLEHMGYSDGRRTSSKSQFRAWTKQAGLVEKGNDREGVAASRPQSISADVAQSIQMLKQGYRPQLRNIEGD